MAFYAFLKISTIPGESTDADHTDWIEILSYSHSLSQPGSGSVSTSGSLTAERCDHQDFSIVKTLDKASPLLAFACCSGQHIDEVTLELCRATGTSVKYMEYILNNVIISSVRPGGLAKEKEKLPLEEVSFRYGKITWRYFPMGHGTAESEGQTEKSWNLITNAAT